MAKKLLFRPSNKSNGFVKETEVRINWVSHITGGRDAASQNVISLHKELTDLCNIQPEDILEVSGASNLELGMALSAMNLGIKKENHPGMYRKNESCVESLYQGSKVFDNGGPYHEVYGYTGIAAKKKIRRVCANKKHKRIIGFNYKGKEYPSEPKDSFYNWLYIKTLCHESNRELMDAVVDGSDFFGFTDIFFNHERQKACQARALAIFIGMVRENYSIGEAIDFDEHVKIREIKQYQH